MAQQRKYHPPRTSATWRKAYMGLLADGDAVTAKIETQIESDLRGVTVYASLARLFTDTDNGIMHPVRTFPVSRLKEAVQFARKIRRGEIAERDVRDMALAYKPGAIIEPEDIAVEMF